MFALIILRQPLQPDTCGKLDMVKNVYKDPTIHRAWNQATTTKKLWELPGSDCVKTWICARVMGKHNGGSGIGKLEERNPPPPQKKICSKVHMTADQSMFWIRTALNGWAKALTPTLRTFTGAPGDGSSQMLPVQSATDFTDIVNSLKALTNACDFSFYNKDNFLQVCVLQKQFPAQLYWNWKKYV